MARHVVRLPRAIPSVQMVRAFVEAFGGGALDGPVSNVALDQPQTNAGAVWALAAWLVGRESDPLRALLGGTVPAGTPLSRTFRVYGYDKRSIFGCALLFEHGSDPFTNAVVVGLARLASSVWDGELGDDPGEAPAPPPPPAAPPPAPLVPRYPSLTYDLDEYPPFAFCESTAAGSVSKWHIRCLTAAGLRLGGGIDSPGLCGRPTVGQGWDLRVRITQSSLASACPKCRLSFDEQAAARGLTIPERAGP